MAPVHSFALSFTSIIEAPAASEWLEIQALLERKAPWAFWDESKPLNHVPPLYPWKCHVTGCDYSVQDAEEQADNEAELATLRRGKSQ